MSWLKNNLEQCKIGFDGESKIRQWFINKAIPFMQVDIMWKSKGRWCLGEIKTQEKFLAPPYDGHGLPKWQIDRRIEFYKDTGVEPYLIVYDLNDKCIYIESLLVLTKKESFQTNGKKPRVIFKLENFTRLEI